MQMVLFAHFVDGRSSTNASSTRRSSSVGENVQQENSSSKSESISLTLKVELRKIELDNEGRDAVHCNPGVESSADADMERLARGVLGRALLDIFEKQTTPYHRRTAMLFILSRKADWMETRNLWCQWAGVHPEKLIEKVMRRIRRMRPSKPSRTDGTLPFGSRQEIQ